MNLDAINHRLVDAKRHVSFGMPMPNRSRLRAPKRLIYRSLLFLLHHQVIVNRKLIESIEWLKEDSEMLALGLRQDRIDLGDVLARFQREQIRLQLSFHQLEHLVTDVMKSSRSEVSGTPIEATLTLEASTRLPEPVLAESPDEFPMAWDDIRLSFQEESRGASELVRQRWRLYLGDIRGVRSDGQIVLDLGCGRGEWLQFLADEGVASYGIDHHEQSVKEAADQGLDARCEDLFTHLRGLPSESLAAITAFNLVEHMSIEDLLLLLELSFHCLVRGGLLIIETPNPENIFVATRDPYLNPTRRSTIPPPLLSTLISSCGFTNASVQRLHRTEMHRVSEAVLGELDQALAALLRRLQDAVITGEDYAVLARRP